jgi:hypothetical protein
MNVKEGKEMLIVGQVSSEEEKHEITFIAQIFTIETRFRYLARQMKKK